MTNPTEPKQQYEGAILQQLIKNSERLAVVEKDISQIRQELEKIKKTIFTAQNWLVAIFIGIIVNIFSQPILAFFNH